VYGAQENRTADVDARSDPTHEAVTTEGRRLSVALAIRGVLAVAFGVLVLVWPGITLLALAFVFAAYVLADGIGLIVSGVSARGGRRWSYVFAGVVGLIAGIAAAVWPGVTVLVLVLWVGAWAVVTGVLEVAAAWRRAGSDRWLTALAGVLSVIAGVIVFVYPGIGALSLAIVLGVYALVAGASLLWAAWEARRAHVVVLA
jgi:uncharacterized membrane protein HdeD (DUF308 family)